MKQLSIKLRVTLFYTAILAVILSLMLGFVFLALDLRIVYSTRADLESAVENAFDDIDFKGGQLEIDSGIDLYHDGITLVLYGPAGTLLLGGTPAGFPAETPLIADTHQGVEGGGRKWQVFDMYVGYGETGVWVGNLLPQRKRFRAELCDGCFHGELPARIATLRGGRLPDHQAGFSPRGAHYPGGKPHFRQRRPLRTPTG